MTTVAPVSRADEEWVPPGLILLLSPSPLKLATLEAIAELIEKLSKETLMNSSV